MFLILAKLDEAQPLQLVGSTIRSVRDLTLAHIHPAHRNEGSLDAWEACASNIDSAHEFLPRQIELVRHSIAAFVLLTHYCTSSIFFSLGLGGVLSHAIY